jgi:hypothetical protein
LLPGHSPQWDKIIISVAQMQFCLFVLLGEYINIKRKKYSLYYLTKQVVMILTRIQKVPSLNLDCGTGYPDREFLWFSSATPSE